jgi:hypothetical protein
MEQPPSFLNINPAGPIPANCRSDRSNACASATKRRAAAGAQNKRPAPRERWAAVLSQFGGVPRRRQERTYLRWFDTSLVISNIDTCFLPPKTCLSFSSALIRRRLIESCSLFFLM